MNRTDLNGSVVDGGGADDDNSFEFDNMMLFVIQNKI
jgi:hypothetical protein